MAPADTGTLDHALPSKDIDVILNLGYLSMLRSMLLHRFVLLDEENYPTRFEVLLGLFYEVGRKGHLNHFVILSIGSSICLALICSILACIWSYFICASKDFL